MAVHDLRLSIDSSDYDYDSDDKEEKSLVSSKHDIAHEKRKRYSKICESLGIRVISLYIENLTQNDLLLAHRGVGSKAMYGIALSLRHNIWITNIDLTDNNLDTEGAQSIANMFEDNNYIKRINLSCNRIGFEGVKILLHVLKYKSTVTYLNISENRLTDRIAKPLHSFLCTNKSIAELHLNKNDLSSECGIKLREALERNCTLKYLNLSWNQIRGSGAVEIAKGLERNSSLTKLNFAWNGFSDQGTEAIARSLLTNSTVQELDLSYNRITDKGARFLGTTLETNTTLRILRLGWNPIRAEGIDKIFKGCSENIGKNVKELHFESIFVTGDIKKNMDNLLKKLPELKVIVGGFTKPKINADDEDKLRKELLNILRTYLVKHRLRMVDLFNQWDKDKSYSITRDEFRAGVKSCKIPFTDCQLNILIGWLDNDDSDSIEYSEFLGITDIE